jgi:hypothetical protein
MNLHLSFWLDFKMSIFSNGSDSNAGTNAFMNEITLMESEFSFPVFLTSSDLMLFVPKVFSDSWYLFLNHYDIFPEPKSCNHLFAIVTFYLIQNQPSGCLYLCFPGRIRTNQSSQELHLRSQ